LQNNGWLERGKKENRMIAGGRENFKENINKSSEDKIL
jgi:hypothetical protein